MARLNSIVILQDCVGRPNRISTLRHAHPLVRAVTPENKPHPYAATFPIPVEWLPENSEPTNRTCWFKADAMALAAARHLNIEADYYWFIESDVVAGTGVWKTLFETTKDIDVDDLAVTIGRKGPSSRFAWWDHEGTPPNARLHHIMAVYRLSHRALQASIQQAPSLRNTFSEIAVPHVILSNGMTISDINSYGRFYADHSMRTRPGEVLMEKFMLNHPVKSDTPHP